MWSAARLEGERRQTARLLQRTVSSLTEERAQLRRQLDQQRPQAALLHRLRHILLGKELQHHALAGVLKEIKVWSGHETLRGPVLDDTRPPCFWSEGLEYSACSPTSCRCSSAVVCACGCRCGGVTQCVRQAELEQTAEEV